MSQFYFKLMGLLISFGLLFVVWPIAVQAKLVAVDLQTIPSQPDGIDVTSGVPDSGQNETVDVATADNGGNELPVVFPGWIVAAAMIILGGLILGRLMLSVDGKDEPGPQSSTIYAVDTDPRQTRLLIDTHPNALEQHPASPDRRKKS